MIEKYFLINLSADCSTDLTVSSHDEASYSLAILLS